MTQKDVGFERDPEHGKALQLLQAAQPLGPGAPSDSVMLEVFMAGKGAV